MRFVECETKKFVYCPSFENCSRKRANFDLRFKDFDKINSQR